MLGNAGAKICYFDGDEVRLIGRNDEYLEPSPF